MWDDYRMTRAPGAEVPAFDTFDEAVGILKRHGLRLSSARRTLLVGLFAVDRLVTADEIASGLGGLIEPSDPPVVYRNLETFEELGLVRHVHLEHGPGRYVIAAGGAREYLVCERCARVVAVCPAVMDLIRHEIQDRFGFDATFEHFPIIGVCTNCA